MLKNAIVTQVQVNTSTGIITVYMQNGDHFSTDQFKPDQVDKYITLLKMEDGLEFPGNLKVQYVTDKDDYSAQKPLLRVQCFGIFEVFYEDKPVYFERKGAKEILAFLIDKRGASVNRVDICTAIWEDAATIERRKTYFRTLIKTLKETLEAYGAEEVFIRRRDEYAINTSLIDCDYYRFLGGDLEKSVKFRGEYMSQYSWGENTLGQLVEETGFVY